MECIGVKELLMLVVFSVDITHYIIGKLNEKSLYKQHLGV